MRAVVVAALLLPGAAWAQAPFAIRVVDEGGRAVPCATLRTVHKAVYTTDRNGVIAVYEPDLMGADVWFETVGPPWELPADGFGFSGVRLRLEEGGEAEVVVAQTDAPGPCDVGDGASRLVAQGLPERAGMFGVRVVDATTARGLPLAELRAGGRSWISDDRGRIAIVAPELLGTVVDATLTSHGYDGTTATLRLEPGGEVPLELVRRNLAERLYRTTGAGRLRDSILLGEAAPQGLPGAVVGLDSTHSTVHDGGVFWIWGDTLRASYPLGHFRTAAATSPLEPLGDDGPAFDFFVGDDGFSRPVADIADFDLVWTSGLVSVPDPAGDALVGSFVHLGGDWERHDAGMLLWDPEREAFDVLVSWGDVALPAEPTGTAFVEDGFVWFTDIVGDPSAFGVVRVPATLDALRDPDRYERMATVAGALRDPFGDTEVGDHIGSVFWNEHLGRYLRIAARPFGDDAFLGETWASVADTPMGPWAWATKVVTHDDYSFYNPRHHPQFDEDGGRVVHFDGTYAHTFSGSDPTPRYDYNPVMYRLDVEDLVLPVPVYGERLWTRRNRPPEAADEAAAFYALDRPAEGSVALRWTGPDCSPRSLSPEGAGEVAFHVLPEGRGPHMRPLYPTTRPGRATAYGFVRPPGAEAVGWVWPSHIEEAFPVSEHPGPGSVGAGADVCVDAGAVTLVGTSRVEGAGRWRLGDRVVDGETFVLDEGEGVFVLTYEVEGENGVASDVVVVEVGGEVACACAASEASPSWLWGLCLVARRRRSARAAHPQSPERSGPSPRQRSPCS